MKYREVEFPDGKIEFIETKPTFGKHIQVSWMGYHKSYPVAFASEWRFGRFEMPFAIVGPPNFIERWFGVTHESKIKKQVDRAYKKIEKELVEAKYQGTVRA